MKKTAIDAANEDFARMYEESFSTLETFKPGQAVDTTILSISKDTVFLQASGKSEGLLDKNELLDAEGFLTAQVGDPLRVYFLQAKNGELRFTTKLGKDSAGPEMLEQAYANRIPVEGLVEKEVKGGYEVKIGNTRAFCPFSQMGSRRSESPATWIGTNQTFRITEYRDGGRKVLVSNRVLHEEVHQKKLEDLRKTLKVGDVVKGTVASLQEYGAFVDIGGIQALLPASEVGRARVEDLKTVLTVGQEVEAQIIKTDWSAERISLSMKALAGDPWDQAKSKYPEGTKFAGKVVRITDFGAFISLEPGLDGLLHNSELRGNSKFGSPEVALKAGQTLNVQITGVDAKNRRISLKLASSREEDETAAKYMESSAGGDTYNPFAALLKKK